jgi:hypothetical protein
MVATRFTLGLLAGLACALTAAAAEVRGRIVRVDLDKNELQLEARRPVRGQSLTLTLGPKTEVLFGKQAGALTDLAANRRARIVYEDRDGRPFAQVIHVLGPRPARTPARTPARADGNAVTGVLRRVALTDREVVVIGPGARGPETETTVAVPEGARITRGDKVIAFDALKEGEQVKVLVERKGGGMVAVSIHVGPGEPPAMRGRADLIPRLRRALQAADAILEQIEKDREKKP